MAFTLLGLSGVGSALVAAILPYRPFFFAATLGLLGVAHYLLWRNRRRRPWNLTIVWGATALALGQLAFPYLWGWLGV